MIKIKKTIILLVVCILAGVQSKAQFYEFATRNITNLFCDSTATSKWANSQWKHKESQVVKVDVKGFMTELSFYDSVGGYAYGFKFYRNTNNVLDSALIFYSMGGNVINSARYDYVYDADTLIETINIYQYQGPGPLQLGSRETYKHNSDKLWIEMLGERYKSGSWENHTKKEKTYNANKLEDTQIEYEWDGSAWEPYEKDEISYDVNNKKTGEIKSKWSGSAWEVETRETISYNGANQISLTEEYKSGSYVNSMLDTSYYKTSGNLDYKISYSWDGSAWVYAEKDVCNPGGSTGGGSAPAQPTNLKVVGTKKVNDAKMLLTWDDNANNEDGFIIQRGTDSTNFSTIDSVKVVDTETYTDTGLSYSTQYYYRVLAYNANGVSAPSNFAEATTLTAIMELGASLGLKLYPNPVTNNLLNIQFNGEKHLTYRISSLEGKTLLNGAISQSTIINLQNIQTGIYILELSDAKSITRSQIQILK